MKTNLIFFETQISVIELPTRLVILSRVPGVVKVTAKCLNKQCVRDNVNYLYYFVMAPQNHLSWKNITMLYYYENVCLKISFSSISEELAYKKTVCGNWHLVEEQNSASSFWSSFSFPIWNMNIIIITFPGPNPSTGQSCQKCFWKLPNFPKSFGQTTKLNQCHTCRVNMINKCQMANG